MEALKAFLSQGSTLRGLVMVAISVGLTQFPQYQTEILSVGTAVLGALGVGINEPGVKAP